MERIEWDTLWIGLADLVSQRSVDPKLKVGCAIVSSDNTRVLAIGYNGDHKGGPNERESMISGSSGFIHAEINALIKCDFATIGEKKIYLTHSPCKMCAKAIINAGIKEVIYKNIYDQSSIDFIKNFVNIRKI
jgi:dCMP deaminase